jgi:hypothetical protein
MKHLRMTGLILVECLIAWILVGASCAFASILKKRNEKIPHFNIKTSKQQQQKDRKNKKVNNLKTPEGSAFVTIVRDHIHNIC